jgi:hypothetical protein
MADDDEASNTGYTAPPDYGPEADQTRESSQITLTGESGYPGHAQDAAQTTTDRRPPAGSRTNVHRAVDKPSSAEKYVRFFLFGVGVSLTPFLLSAADDFARKTPVTLATLFGHGELAILAVIIAGGAAGEVFLGERPRRHRSAQAVLGGCITIFLVTATGWFSNVSFLANTSRPDPPRQVAVLSICVFGAALVFGLTSLIMSGD